MGKDRNRESRMRFRASRLGIAFAERKGSIYLDEVEWTPDEAEQLLALLTPPKPVKPPTPPKPVEPPSPPKLVKPPQQSKLVKAPPQSKLVKAPRQSKPVKPPTPPKTVKPPQPPRFLPTAEGLALIAEAKRAFRVDPHVFEDMVLTGQRLAAKRAAYKRRASAPQDEGEADLAPLL